MEADGGVGVGVSVIQLFERFTGMITRQWPIFCFVWMASSWSERRPHVLFPSCQSHRKDHQGQR